MEKTSMITFNSELFGEVRFVDVEGKPFAVANDIADALGYKRPRKAIQDHCKGVLKWDYLTEGGNQELNIISESDIYRLVFKSKLKKAQLFESWVMEEVLPQIRQTGGYVPVKEEDGELEILSKAFLIAQNTLSEKDKLLEYKDAMITEQGNIIKEQGVIVDYYNKVIEPPKLISSTDLAKDLGMSAVKLHRVLHLYGLIYKKEHERCWKFYCKYESMVPEYADYNINEYAQTLKWTEKGRKFIIDLVENEPRIAKIINDIDEERRLSKLKRKNRRLNDNR